jgi:GGDEF domain-containing protein
MTFNRAELDQLERRELLHLTILSAVIVLVLAAGVALLMYPVVFVHPAPGNKWNPRFGYLGFCLLSLLFVGYLLDRHRVFRRLKQGLLDELERNLELRDQANADLLHTIPDLNNLRDRLTMEFRRAASMQHALSLLVVKIKLTTCRPESNEGRAALGEAARAMSRKLRASDSISMFGPGLFGLVLPAADTAQARDLSLRLKDVLAAVGATNGFSAEFSVYNFPEHVKSAHELEQAVNSLLPEDEAWLAETHSN